ncbi:MAG: hypothetical protein ABEJ93_04705 [Candidatus Nanohalobium sp.]
MSVGSVYLDTEVVDRAGQDFKGRHMFAEGEDATFILAGREKEFSVYQKSSNSLDSLNTLKLSELSQVKSFDASGKNVLVGIEDFRPGSGEYTQYGSLSFDPEDRISRFLVMNKEGLIQRNLTVDQTHEEAALTDESIFLLEGEKLYRYDREGNFEWVRKLGYPDIRPNPSDEVNSVLRVKDGEVYVGATVPNGKNFVAVIKFSVDGERQWGVKKSYRGWEEEIRSLKVSDNAVYAASILSTSEPFSKDVFVTKVSRDGGKELWSQNITLKGMSDERTCAIDVRPEGGVKLLSYTRKTVKLKPPLKHERKNFLVNISGEGKRGRILKTRDLSSKQVFFDSGRPYAVKGLDIVKFSKKARPREINWDLDLPLGPFSTKEYWETDFYDRGEQDLAAYIDRKEATTVNLSTEASDGEVVLQMENTGNETVYTSDFKLYYQPPNYDGVSLPREGLETFSEDSREFFVSKSDCFKENVTLRPGEQVNCGTGVNSSVSSSALGVVAVNFDYEKLVEVD